MSPPLLSLPSVMSFIPAFFTFCLLSLLWHLPEMFPALKHQKSQVGSVTPNTSSVFASGNHPGVPTQVSLESIKSSITFNLLKEIFFYQWFRWVQNPRLPATVRVWEPWPQVCSDFLSLPQEIIFIMGEKTEKWLQLLCACLALGDAEEHHWNLLDH